jgi:hypothetical protein
VVFGQSSYEGDRVSGVVERAGNKPKARLEAEVRVWCVWNFGEVKSEVRGERVGMSYCGCGSSVFCVCSIGNIVFNLMWFNRCQLSVGTQSFKTV